MFVEIRLNCLFELIRNEHDISMIRALSLGLNLTKRLISVKRSKLMRERWISADCNAWKRNKDIKALWRNYTKCPMIVRNDNFAD